MNDSKDAGNWTCDIESYVFGATRGDKDIATINVIQFCGAGEYKCENSGICIGVDQICDGTVDCPDNEEDEWTCTEEPTKCLGPSKVCDGIKDCDNNEDEEKCCNHSKLAFYIFSRRNHYAKH